MSYRFEVRPGFRGSPASFQPEIDSGFTLTSFSEVVSQEFWLALSPFRIHFRKHDAIFECNFFLSLCNKLE